MNTRSLPYVNWCISIGVTASDGYRMQRVSFDLNDGWSGQDAIGCREALGMSAAGLIKAIESSGIAIYGGSAMEGFAEGYQDQADTTQLQGHQVESLDERPALHWWRRLLSRG